MIWSNAIVVGLVCAFISLCRAQDSNCTTPEGGVGVCMHFSRCTHLMDLLSPGRRTEETVSFVKSRVCGNASEQTVCCNDCYTPDGKAGICTHIQSCPHILYLVQNMERLDYMKKSICRNGMDMHVCCGPPPSPIVKYRCQSQMGSFPVDPATECCGLENSLGKKITGGKDTRIDQFPWLAILEYQVRNRLMLKCGGTLISGRYVITAAHCIVGRRARGLVSVRLGEFNTQNEGRDCVSGDCADPPISVPIVETIPHPEYNETSVWNDIALLRLAETVNYTEFIRPICLPWSDATEEAPLQTLRAYAAGWGQVKRGVPSSDTKQHVQLPLVNTRVCQRVHSQLSDLKTPLWSKQLCAGGERGKDSCSGDSGGPLVVERLHPVSGSDTHELIGVISFGPRACGTENLPAIYTKVHEYDEWIRSHLRP